LKISGFLCPDDAFLRQNLLCPWADTARRYTPHYPAEMDEYLIAVILGIIEGFTEFLPISSTGHLILASRFLGFTGDFAATFDVFIQMGAILSVVIYFREKLFPFGGRNTLDEKREGVDLWKKTIIGVVPALIVGAAFGIKIRDALFDPVVVAVALFVGGVALILIDRNRKDFGIDSLYAMSYKTAFLIGLIQCFSFIPGVSRSAATIIGAMLLGTTRLVAAEYSFYLAVPTLAGASLYSLYKGNVAYTGMELQLLAIGFIVSFIVAYAVIAGFIDYVSKRDFKIFGYYRIVLGALVLAFCLL